jgi:flagellar biosynthesis/type III secretory pathway chaperone
MDLSQFHENMSIMQKNLIRLKQERAELHSRAESCLINRRYVELSEIANQLEQITESIRITNQDLNIETKRLNESMVEQINAKLYDIYFKPKLEELKK